MFLPDINFWLALTFEVHAHHVRAKEFFDTHPVDQFSFPPLLARQIFSSSRSIKDFVNSKT